VNAFASGTSFFLRVGPKAWTVGPFKHQHTALAWLTMRGYRLQDEGATWKIYEATSPNDERLKVEVAVADE
jgi:hypothetical protein